MIEHKRGDIPAEGFESPFGLELLSAVHWVISRQQAHTVEDVAALTYLWCKGQNQFPRHQSERAVNVLFRNGWIANFGNPVQA